MAKKSNRSENVREFLRRAKNPKSVREICDGLGIKADEAKFVSSQLVREAEEGVVEVATDDHKCSVSGRSVVAYIFCREEAKPSRRKVAKAKATIKKAPKPKATSAKAAPAATTVKTAEQVATA